MPDAAPAAPVTPTAPQGNGAAGHQAPAPAPEAGGGEPRTPATPAGPSKTYKINVRGQVREVSEATLLAMAQKTEAADAYLAEAKRKAAEAEAKAAGRKEKWGKDWRAALQEDGVDPQEFIRRAVLEQYGQEEMTPEQKELAKERTRAESAEAELERIRQERLTAQQEAEEQEALSDYQQRFLGALDKMGWGKDPAAPLTAWAIRQMAALEEANLDAGTQLPPEVLAEMARADLAEQQKAVFAGLEGDALLDLLGDETVKRITKATIARFERKRAGGQQIGSTAQAPTDPRTVASPGRAVAVTLPRDPNSGQFKSREQIRAETPFRSAFIPASIQRG